jgi:Arc/MetJ-type ribon-helix-helix transcriptional regulator
MSNNNQGVVKLSLHISKQLNELLEELVKQTGSSSKTEVLKKAIALMEVAVRAKQEQKFLGISNSKENLETEIIGI